MEQKEIILSFIWDEKKIVFLGSKTPSSDAQLFDIRMIDPTSHKISASLPPNRLFGDPSFCEAYEKALGLKKTYLAHHGIKGQEWGVRNGPPYPLDHRRTKKNQTAGRTISAVIRVATKKGIDKVFSTLEARQKRLAKEHIESLTAKYVKEIKTDSQELSQRGITDSENEFSEKNPPKKIAGDHTIDEDASSVNLLFNEKDEGARNNCVLCTSAYDLRRRGYNVIANLTKKPVSSEALYSEVYKDYSEDQYRKYKTYTDIFSSMCSKYPDGSRGFIGIRNDFGGHAISFEIRSSKLVLIDAQEGKVYNDPMSYPMLRYTTPKLTSSARLDNLDLNYDKLNIVCSERK